MNYEVDIAGMKRSLKLFKVSDDLQIAAFILYGDVEITMHAAKELLAQDPRPGYQDDPDREYKMDYAGLNVTFQVQKGAVLVKNIEKS